MNGGCTIMTTGITVCGYMVGFEMAFAVEDRLLAMPTISPAWIKCKII